jgi:hypothetical protein
VCFAIEKQLHGLQMVLIRVVGLARRLKNQMDESCRWAITVCKTQTYITFTYYFH